MAPTERAAGALRAKGARRTMEGMMIVSGWFGVGGGEWGGWVGGWVRLLVGGGGDEGKVEKQA